MAQVKHGPMTTYDDFNIGIAEERQGQNGVSPFINLAFREGDLDGTPFEGLNLVHVFRIHKDKIDDLINLLQQAKGSRIHVPTADDRGNLKI